MSVSKKQQYVPIGLTVLGELSSNTLGSNIYISEDYNGLSHGNGGHGGSAYPGWEEDYPKDSREPVW